MTTRLTFHGVACYELVSDRGRVLVDPFLTGNPVATVGPDDLAPPDVIVASHAAWDHMGDAAAVAIRTEAPVICGTDTAALLRQSGVPAEQIKVTVWGICIRVRDLHKPTVGLLGCTQPWSLITPGAGEVLTGEMNPNEAALAAEFLGVRFAVATHYETPDHRDVQEFLEAVPRHDTSGKRVPLALRSGQTLVLTGDDYQVED